MLSRNILHKGSFFLNSRHFSSGKTLHNAAPQMPLLFYRASNRAMQSINHRVFYANWIAVFAFFDLGSAFVDF